MGTRGSLQIVEGRGGCLFYVHLVPRARRDEVVGLYGEALKVRLKAPPVRGKANDSLRSFLAEELGVSRDDVVILSGQSSRHKHVRVVGVTPDRVRSLISI